MSKKSEIRSLKLQPEVVIKPHSMPDVLPKLLIKGKWFQSAGFEPGMTVEVQVENGKLTVVPCQAIS